MGAGAGMRYTQASRISVCSIEVITVASGWVGDSSLSSENPVDEGPGAECLAGIIQMSARQRQRHSERFPPFPHLHSPPNTSEKNMLGEKELGNQKQRTRWFLLGGCGVQMQSPRLRL